MASFAPSTARQGAPDIQIDRPPGPAPERASRQRGKHLWFALDGVRYVGPHGLVIDSFGGARMALYGPGTTANPPLPFYGTMAAVLLATRGLVPLHGSSVEWNGKAVLFCGPGGAGKSTLAAAMLARGAKLLADDLSVLHCRPGAVPQLFPGRITLRLHPGIAKVLLRSVPCGLAETAGPKIAVTPRRADPSQAVPLGAVVLLTGQNPGAVCFGSLAEQLYRPKAMRELPGHRWRLSALAFAQAQLPLLSHETGSLRSEDDLHRAADRVIRMLHRAGL